LEPGIEWIRLTGFDLAMGRGWMERVEEIVHGFRNNGAGDGQERESIVPEPLRPVAEMLRHSGACAHPKSVDLKE
jgi:hypothetical protein